ncbi:TonB-dependent receptor plug domain-containing protein [Sphingobacterium sp. KU25419]|nr:TonB-dependent receptor plug domain-containing protein [Sphingobacterium sp. KU25419]
MKITTLLIIAGLQVSANVFSQEISINVKNARLKEVLSSIRKQTGYNLVYNTELINNANLISIDFNKLSLQQAMTLLFTNQPFDYELNGKTLLITPKNKNTKTTPSVSIQEQTIASGRITDANNKPLAGVTVKEKGTSNVTTTSENGAFKLSVKDARSILVFSYVGYTTSEKPAGSQMNFIMEENSSAMDEVVVVGYGKQKKINLTGAVSTVSAKQLESRPVQNLGQALQGMVPGLNLQTSGLGGELNQTMSVNIRGAGTIGVGSSSSVLVLIDGMEGDMNALNPQDIENISVLKDAASAAIYGSRAPFGVILITTKAGKIGNRWSTTTIISD